ncbi:ABC transporter permease [Kurthia sibirica]|uniref:ABC transporter permease n=1 Tax=Kurthia sibirica TaxID=202750 RepID=A0A2U3AHE2_9BACL|nr:ABC transporter permease [Kurthia sibirica]PWI23871.1 ABC transporter permease [Kurthia sibirica]GEK35054.1 antibiotic ABC transporter permease [Kurthia sibirica]
MKTLAMVKRIINQLKRDKRTLALLFLAPMLVLTLMYFIFESDDPKTTLVVTNAQPTVVEQLKKTSLTIVEKDQYSESKLKSSEYAAWLEFKNPSKLYLLNAEPSSSKAVEMAIASLSMQPQKQKMATTYVYGDKNTKVFDIFSPMLIGFFVFFFVFLIAGMALLKERTTGTLERLLATPIKRGEIILGYIIGFGFFALIQTIIIVLYAVYVLKIESVGSIGYVFLICIIVALVALSLGTFLSSFAATEFQMVQFIPLVIVPQVFFSGIFPLDNMAEWLQGLGRIMPMYYVADALNGVMYKGFGFSDIWLDLLILLGFSAIFLLLNMLGLKKYRAI